MYKLLLKRAFKSLFKNKLFVILMSLLILITSGAYTIFESASSSFRASYDNVVAGNALHDLVIKENFQIPDQDEVKVTFVQKQDSTLVVLDNNSLAANKIPIANQPNWFTVSLAPDKDYAKYNLLASSLIVSVPFELSSNPSPSDYALKAIEVAASAKAIIEAKLKEKLKFLFVKSLNDIYSSANPLAHNIADFNEMSAIAIEDGIAAYKVINYNEDTKVNKMHIYDGIAKFIPALTNQQMVDALNQKIAQATAQTGAQFGPANMLKGYKITAQSTVGEVLSIVDASSYEAIVSPTYANKTNKKAVSLQKFTELVNKFPYEAPGGAQYNFFDALSNRVPQLVETYKDSIIWISNMPFIITGIGVTPDFAYPIIDERHPTIDADNQALAYVSQRGFERTIDSFRTNPKENYISVRFHNNVSFDERQRYKKEFEEFCQTGVSHAIQGTTVIAPKNQFAANIQMVTNYDDPNDQMTLTQERVSFLGQLKNTINTISYTTTTLLIVFVSIIVAMVFGVLVTSSRKSLATLLAIGYTKAQIAITTASISLLIGAVPSIIGYFIGFGAQYAFIDSFSSFWTIPTYGNAFSAISFIITFALPSILLFALIFIVTFVSLRHPINAMINDHVGDNSWIVAKIMSPMHKVGIKTKYAMALTLRNSGKVLLVSMTTTIASMALMVGFATVGQASAAYASTVASTNYEYKVDLFSPTKEGGQYSRVYFGKNNNNRYGYFLDKNKTQSLSYRETYNDSQMSDSDRDIPHWHVPGTGDKAIALPDDPLTVNDPSLLLTLEKRIASYLENKLQTKGLINITVAGVNPWATASQLMPDNQLNTANNNLDQIINLAKAQNKSIATPQQFMDFISDPDVVKAAQPYLITYNTVVTDEGDETYTYIDSDVVIKGQQLNYRLAGIDQNSVMYNLPPHTIGNLDERFADDPNFIPIIVNKYAAANFGLNKGSTFTGVIKNDATRNFDNYTTHAIAYKVIDIMESYNDAGFVTSQAIANQVLGLDPGAFNGIMSKNKQSALLGSLPLYSPSGIYLAVDSLTKGTVWEKWLNLILQNQSLWQYQTQIAADFDEFVNRYTASPLISMISKVDWQKMNQLTFQSISRLTSILIDVIEGISIALSVLFAIIVISLIVRTNRKRIATLWTIGYRKTEIVRIFAFNLIIPLILALAIAAPVVVGLLAGIKHFIMHFGHILIPFSLYAWIPFVVIGMIAVVYVIVTSIAIRSLSSAHALEAFKED